jgi:hypothetical protein
LFKINEPEFGDPGVSYVHAPSIPYQAMLARLRQSNQPAFAVSVGSVPAANVYVLDSKSLAALRGE